MIGVEAVFQKSPYSSSVPDGVPIAGTDWVRRCLWFGLVRILAIQAFMNLLPCHRAQLSPAVLPNRVSTRSFGFDTHAVAAGIVSPRVEQD